MYCSMDVVQSNRYEIYMDGHFSLTLKILALPLNGSALNPLVITLPLTIREPTDIGANAVRLKSPVVLPGPPESRLNLIG